DKRRGLLIHDGNRGITAGCIGIKGDFEQFQKDLGAEMERNGGKPVKLRLGAPETFGVATNGAGGQRFAENDTSGKTNDASGALPQKSNFGGSAASLPGQTSDAYTGPFQNLSPEQRLRLANKAETRIRQEVALTQQAVKSFDSLAEKGYAPEASQVEALRAKVESSREPRLIQEFREAEAILQWQGAARQARPEELDAYIRGKGERVRAQGATPFDAKRLEIADKLLTNMRQELKSDPLGWADRVGVIKVEPVDFSSPDAAEASLSKRMQQADAVSSHYGTEP